MKTPRNEAPGLHLKKSNNRWKWMAGATAATAAGVTASQAGTITINLLNNHISAQGGNHLNADLTGDGHPDLTISGAFYRTTNRFGPNYPSRRNSFVGVGLNGVVCYAFFSHDFLYGIDQIGSKSLHFHFKNVTSSGTRLTGSIPISFKDLHINGGALTIGSLEVTVGGGAGTPVVQLDSFTYNTPDQGSTLALLATGASGVLALRRWRAGRERS